MAAGEWRTDREFPIKREHVEQWIAKLESGMPQTTGKLYAPTDEERSDGSIKPAGYCCIGVLATVLEDDGIFEPCHTPVHKGTIPGWHFKDEFSGPENGSADPYQAVGYISRMANWKDPKNNASLTDTLWRMNDHRKYRFPEIAKFLREEILPRIPA